MAKWVFQPQHTGAEFCVRHMMVSYVRGHFKNIEGRLDFNPDDPRESSVEARIDAAALWTGVPELDAHLKTADFLDTERYPEITFKGNQVEPTALNEFLVTGDLTIRGIPRIATLDVRCLGQWKTPWWEDGVDIGPKIRAGFIATTRINRLDFGVSWNDTMDKGGLVVSPYVNITIDVEAILEP